MALLYLPSTLWNSFRDWPVLFSRQLKHIKTVVVHYDLCCILFCAYTQINWRVAFILVLMCVKYPSINVDLMIEIYPAKYKHKPNSSKLPNYKRISSGFIREWRESYFSCCKALKYVCRLWNLQKTMMHEHCKNGAWTFSKEGLSKMMSSSTWHL